MKRAVLLGLAGVAIWVTAASVDRVFNSGDALGIALIIAAIVVACRKAQVSK